MLEIRPTHLKPAREFVGKYHRHNIPPVGGKFAISCFEGERLCGVAICGRPTARKLDDGATLEIYRNCTDGTRNACTKLYGACVRIARDMGYKKVITYTLESENGASLRAANFTFAGSAGGIAWTGTRRRDYYVSPEEPPSASTVNIKSHERSYSIMFSKKKTECRVCGYRFTPERENIYTAEEPRSMADMLTKAPTRFSAVDCPVCGCQIALAIRAPRIDFPAIVERHDADAEETEGGEDED